MYLRKRTNIIGKHTFSKLQETKQKIDPTSTLTIVSLFSGAEKWNAVIIGAGFSGLDMGIKLKEIGVRFTILEKSSNLGGTWFDNVYPGAACDVASHLYSLR